MVPREQVALIKGMLRRGDKQHEIAAHFKEHQGRISEINNGSRYPDVPPAPIDQLPALQAPRRPRFLNHTDDIEEQWVQLMDFINNPPKGSYILTITPELAERILERLNTKNRKPRPTNIAKYAGHMLAGSWSLNGETVKFSRGEKMLLDGQNRMMACVRSGTSFTSHVVFGIDDDAFTKIDINAKRTNPDALQVAGVPYSDIIAPAVRHIIIGKDRGLQVENQQLLDYYNTQIDTALMEEIAKRVKAFKNRVIPPSSLAAHLYMFRQKHETTFIKFSNDLLKLQGGAKKLIQRINALREQNMGRVHEQQMHAMIILAWNCYRSGEQVTLQAIKWDDRQEYPEIKK